MHEWQLVDIIKKNLSLYEAKKIDSASVHAWLLFIKRRRESFLLDKSSKK